MYTSIIIYIVNINKMNISNAVEILIVECTGHDHTRLREWARCTLHFELEDTRKDGNEGPWSQSGGHLARSRSRASSSGSWTPRSKRWQDWSLAPAKANLWIQHETKHNMWCCKYRAQWSKYTESVKDFTVRGSFKASARGAPCFILLDLKAQSHFRASAGMLLVVLYCSCTPRIRRNSKQSSK